MASKLTGKQASRAWSFLHAVPATIARVVAQAAQDAMAIIVAPIVKIHST